MIQGVNNVSYGLNELGKEQKTPRIVIVGAIDDMD